MMAPGKDRKRPKLPPPARRKPKTEPDAPVDADDEDIRAARAFFAGVASEGQQLRLRDWIVNLACAYYDLSFRQGGEDGRRASDFMEGRRFVGAMLVGLSKKLPSE